MARSRKSLELSVLNAKDARAQKSPSDVVLKDLLDLLSTPSGLFSVLLANDKRGGGGIDLDFYWTIIRLHQVFSNVVANQKNSDDGPTKYEGALGPILVAGGITFTLIGFARSIYQYLYAKYLKSDAYYEKRLRKLAPGQLDSEEVEDKLVLAIEKRVADFANISASKKFDTAAKAKRLQEPVFSKLTLATPNLAEELIKDLDDELLSLLIGDDVNLLKSKKERARLVERVLKLIAAFKSHQIKNERDLIKATNCVDYLQMKATYDRQILDKKLPLFIRMVNALRENTFMGKVRALYGIGQTGSYLYWLFLMPMIILVGAEAAGATIGVVIATVVVTGASALWKFARWTGKKLGWIDQKMSGEKVVNTEDQRQDHEAKIRHLAVNMHDAVMKVIYGEKAWEDEKAKKALKKALLKKEKEKEKAAKAALGVNVTALTKKVGYSLAEKLADVKKNTALVEAYTGSKLEQRMRLALAVAGAISTFISIVFLSFIGSAVLGLFFEAATIGAFVNVTSVSATAGGFGVLGGLFDFAKIYTEQAVTERKVHTVLSSQYKETGKSNMEVHAGLQHSIRNKIETLKGLNTLSPAQLKIINDMEHTINKKSQAGQRYFDKFQTKTPFFGKFKKLWDPIWTGATNAESGAFVIRYLCLAGVTSAGILAGVMTGGTAWIAFLVVAVVGMMIVGGIGIAKTQLERRQRHREETLDVLPGQIKTYKKWEQELVAMDQLHGTKTLTVSNADQPDKTHKAAVEKSAAIALLDQHDLGKHKGLDLDAVRTRKNYTDPSARVSRHGMFVLAASNEDMGVKTRARPRSLSFNV